MGMANSKFFSKFQTHGENIFFNFSKFKTLVTTQDNNSQVNYLMIKNLKIKSDKFISHSWKRIGKSEDNCPFNGFWQIKKLKPFNRPAQNKPWTKSLLNFKSPSNLLENEPKLAKPEINFSLSPESKLNGSETPCENFLYNIDNSTYHFGNVTNVSPLTPSSMSQTLTPTEFPTTTQYGIPDLTPTVTPSGSPTVTQTANPTVMSVVTDPHLDFDYVTDEDRDDDSSSHDIHSDHDSHSPSDSPRTTPTSTLPTSLSISAPVFSPLVSTEILPFSKLTSTKRRGPPPSIPYDPDAIFGGDSDEDLYDYSDDEEAPYFGYDPCFDPGTGYDPGPCSPRPLSQDQPTTEGLRAWNEERGLFFWGRTSITLLSETDITPSYPIFTPSNLATLGLASPDASPSSPLRKTFLPLPLPDYNWDSFGASSSESAETEAACCSCEPSSHSSVDNSVNPPHDNSLTDPPLDLPLDPKEVCSPVSRRDGPLLPDTPMNSDESLLSLLRSSDGPLDEPRAELPSPRITMEWTSLLTTPPSPLLPPDSRPAELSKHRQRRTTMDDPTKRPWLTPPLPSNMAWRGWVLSKTSMLRKRPPRQPHPSLDFSLSTNERPHRLSIQLHHSVSRQSLRNTTPPVVMKTQWTPRSAARRRLERLRGQLYSLVRKGNKHRQTRIRIGPIPLPPLNIDYPPENKKLEYKTITDTPITDHPDNNKTITVIPPFINLLDSFPEYKTLMYWEVKAG